MHDKNFIAIDFETANKNPSSICEAGICIIKNGVPEKTKSWLVRPPGNFYDPEFCAIHGIFPEDTQNAPAFPQIWLELYREIEKCPTLVAHNMRFDANCLRKTLDYYGLPIPELNYICTLRLSRKLYPGLQRHRLTDLCDIFGFYGIHHRAGSDAELCAKLLLKELDDLPDNYPVDDIFLKK
ncbi:MAG: 3'-5' exonuclease [Opitutales bacterium]|nr:3'-5' exonuclease [Opitutales bacterium]